MTNKVILQHALLKAEQGNTGIFISLMADDIIWTVIGNTAYSGTYHSKDELLNNLAKRVRMQLKQEVKMKFTRFIAEENLVVVESIGSSLTINGEPYDNHYCEIYEFRNGKISSAKVYLDTDLIRSVL